MLPDTNKQLRIVVLAALVLTINFTFLSNPNRLSAAQNSGLVITIDDSVQGSSPQQFDYAGSDWEHCVNCAKSAGVYNQSNSWNGTTDESVTVSFRGTQIKFFGVKGPSNGIGAASIDGGAEATIDFYSARALGNQLLWESPKFEGGEHSFKIRVTGQRNPRSRGNYIAIDRVDIYTQLAVDVPSGTTSTLPGSTQITPLTFRVIDADYSLSLDRIVMVAAESSELHIYNAIAKRDFKVKLAKPAVRVSVSPNGKFAAVAHDALISYINLQQGRITKTIKITGKPHNITLTDNGWIYFLPEGDNWLPVVAVEVATGKETWNSQIEPYHETLFKLHPDGKRLYGATQGISSGDIHVIDISRGTPSAMRTIPLSGSNYPCGRLWIAQDGKHLFTGFGVILRTSSDRKTDGAFAGRLANMKYARSIVHSARARMLLAIPESQPFAPCLNQGFEEATRLLIYDDATFNLLQTLQMPPVGTGDSALISEGYFVFANAQGTRYYLILRANERLNLPNAFAIAVGDLSGIKASKN